MASYFTVPSTQEMYDILRPGLPIRWLEGTIDAGWSYGVIEKFDVDAFYTTQARVTFSGVSMGPNAHTLEVGPREALRRITLTIPGNFNDADDLALLQHDNSTYLNWTEGDAALVRVSAICVKEDSTDNPSINVSIGGNFVFIDGVETTNAWLTSTISVDAVNNYYLTSFDDAIEVGVMNVAANGGPGSTGDAEDLTVELLFVQDRRISFWNHASASDPVLNLVISGAGAPWVGLGNGVHAVIPTMYTTNGWTPTVSVSPTPTKSTRKELWQFQATGSYFSGIRFAAFATRPKPTGTITTGGTTEEFDSFQIRNGSYSTYAYGSTFVSSLGGRIRNKFMSSVTLGATTFTFWKLGTNWQSAFK